VVKAGFNRSGSQRYRCQACHHYFTLSRKPAGYDPVTRDLALRLYLEGSSFRGIAKVLHVNHASVIHWVNAATEHLPATVTDPTPSETLETDELFSFLGKKRARLRRDLGRAREPLDCRGGGPAQSGVGSDARLCGQLTRGGTVLCG
jgi:hypothetical protein